MCVSQRVASVNTWLIRICIWRVPCSPEVQQVRKLGHSKYFRLSTLAPRGPIAHYANRCRASQPPASSGRRIWPAPSEVQKKTARSSHDYLAANLMRRLYYPRHACLTVSNRSALLYLSKQPMTQRIASWGLLTKHGIQSAENKFMDKQFRSSTSLGSEVKASLMATGVAICIYIYIYMYV